jgi:hypothetical protein
MTSPAWLERARANVRAAAEGREEPFRMIQTASVDGSVPCPVCGSWCLSRKGGLETHMRRAHGNGHAAAPRPGRSP